MIDMIIPMGPFEGMQDEETLLVLPKRNKGKLVDLCFEYEVDTFLVLFADQRSAIDRMRYIGFRIRYLGSLIQDLEKVHQETFAFRQLGVTGFLQDVLLHAHSNNAPTDVLAMYRVAQTIGIYTEPFTLLEVESTLRQSA